MKKTALAVVGVAVASLSAGLVYESNTPTERFVKRCVASYTPVIDSEGRTWESRCGAVTGDNISTIADTQAIRGTDNPMLYRKIGRDITKWTIPVPEATRYDIVIHSIENYYTDKETRMFKVEAEGKIVASKLDPWTRNGKFGAVTVTSAVDVTDGELTLDFTALAGGTMVTAVEVEKAVQVGEALRPNPHPRPGIQKVQFDPNSWTYNDLRGAPVAPENQRLVKYLTEDLLWPTHGVSSFNTSAYNTKLYDVTGLNRPKVRLEWENCQNKSYNESILYSGMGIFVDVPLPENPVSAAGTDAMLGIVDRTSDPDGNATNGAGQLWEFWKFGKHLECPPGVDCTKPNPAYATDPKQPPRITDTTKYEWLGKYRACWGGRQDNLSKSDGTFYGTTGTAAAGTSMTSGMISLAEVADGRIDHAIYFVGYAVSSGSSWPAKKGDGDSSTFGTDKFVEGQRMRLRADVDCTYRMFKLAQLVCEAAKVYGFIPADKGGAIGINPQATDNTNADWEPFFDFKWNYKKNEATGLMEKTTKSPYPSYDQFRFFPWHEIEFLPRDYGKPSA